KTGPTEELVDAWLDGYTPDYSTVVWMGYPNKRVSMTSVHGEPQQGGHLPAVIWHEYMSSVLEGQSCVQFPSAKESISYRPFYGKYATTGHSEYVAPVPFSPPPGPSNKSKDRKSTRLNSSHRTISYAVFCLKKKNDRV